MTCILLAGTEGILKSAEVGVHKGDECSAHHNGPEPAGQQGSKWLKDNEQMHTSVVTHASLEENLQTPSR